MSQNYCHHLNAAGAFCRGIPLKKRDYCLWHLNENGRRMKAARARAQAERVILQLPVLDDLHAVQVSLMQLGEAIVHGEVDERKGRLLLAVLRLAASNIKAQGSWLDEAQMQDEDDASYVMENSGFEQQYGLPKGFDLSVDPEVAFPPPTLPLNVWGTRAQIVGSQNGCRTQSRGWIEQEIVTPTHLGCPIQSVI